MSFSFVSFVDYVPGSTILAAFASLALARAKFLFKLLFAHFFGILRCVRVCDAWRTRGRPCGAVEAESVKDVEYDVGCMPTTVGPDDACTEGRCGWRANSVNFSDS